MRARHIPPIAGRAWRAMLLLSFVVSFAACAESTAEPPREPSPTARETPTATRVSAPTPHESLTGGELRILTRDGHIDPEVYDAFTRETGVTIVETTYDDEDELPAILKAAPGSFDLVIASDRILPRLRAEDLLTPLNLNRIANFQNVEARLKSPPFDRDNRHSVPYVWGTVGILYRTDLNVSPIDSWIVVYDRQRNQGLRGKVALLDSPRPAIGAALKALGFSLNSGGEHELAQARELILANSAVVAQFDSAAWSDALLTGEVSVAQAYSDDAAFTQFVNADLRYAIPREGAPLWMDSLVVAKNSAHQAQAEAFINFVLRPENAAKISAYTYSLSPIGEAYNKMDSLKAALFHSGYIPDDERFKRLEFIADVGAAQKLYEQNWSRIKK